MKYTVKDIKDEIRKLGGSLLSEHYKNNKTPIFIRCGHNHIWKTRFSSIKEGHWCPICSSNSYSIDDVKREVRKKKGKLLSKIYKNSKTKLKIKCMKCSCVWNPSFEYILRGRWCPRCSGGKSQRKLAAILKEIYPHCEVRSNYKNFDWLKNEKTGGIQELDIFVYDKKRSFTLAVEYDGEHHFYPVRWGGISSERAQEKFKKTKKRDARKNRLIKNNQKDVKYFIRVKYIIDLNKESVKYELEKNSIPT